jgi:prophage DNA circulation protein
MMFKDDAIEAAAICKTVLTALLTWTGTAGRSGADLRTAALDFIAHATVLLYNRQAGDPLANVFALAVTAGITIPQIEQVRSTAAAQAAASVGAMVTRDSLVQLSLATIGTVLGNTTFKSREEVEAQRSVLNGVFATTEEALADSMDSETYLDVISLHAAISRYLTVTAQPLPRVLPFQFAEPLTTLVAAYRLYTDASRADELRDGNDVVHPAFMPPTGYALSN